MTFKINFFKILFSLFALISVQAVVAQTAHPKDTPDNLTARAGKPAVDPFADEFTVVRAAGMEMLLEDEEMNSEMVDDMISFARRFMGTRYVHGGKKPGGFDCSGFTSYVFGQFGYKITSASRGQATIGRPISNRSDVLPGDILLFSGRGGGSTVGHVAIAIDTDPATGVVTFIHASVSKGITIDKTSGAYYAKRYLGARRIVGVL